MYNVTHMLLTHNALLMGRIISDTQNHGHAHTPWTYIHDIHHGVCIYVRLHTCCGHTQKSWTNHGTRPHTGGINQVSPRPPPPSTPPARPPLPIREKIDTHRQSTDTDQEPTQTNKSWTSRTYVIDTRRNYGHTCPHFLEQLVGLDIPAVGT